MTKTQRLAKALASGQNFTAGQISDRFGIANVPQSIQALREQGYSIYLNSKKTKVGKEPISVYQLGAPTKRLVAAGYAKLGARASGMVSA